jgi:hypothetical protein
MITDIFSMRIQPEGNFSTDSASSVCFEFFSDDSRLVPENTGNHILRYEWIVLLKKCSACYQYRDIPTTPENSFVFCNEIQRYCNDEEGDMSLFSHTAPAPGDDGAAPFRVLSHRGSHSGGGGETP